jgi:glycosyltransferase involved in cell wall biosynthesis
MPPYCHQYHAKGGLNVGSFFAETEPVPGSWASRANLLDLQVVPCRDQADALRASPHYRKPVEVVGLPSDVSKFDRQYPVPKAIEGFKRGRFLFYTVGEYVKRKGFSLLVRAFVQEFRLGEPVGLVLKVSKERMMAAELVKGVTGDVEAIKAGCGLTRTPPVLVLGERLSEDELCGLHQACDVFVQPSHAESWSYPSFDAMGFGKTPIVTDWGGFREYVDTTTGYPLSCRKEPVFGEGRVHAELFTGRATWAAPDLLDIQTKMREAYTDAVGRAAKAASGRLRVREFDHGHIGARLLKVFEDAQKCRAERLGSGTR